MITQDHPLIDFRMSVLAKRTHLVTEIISNNPRMCNLPELLAEQFLLKVAINGFMLNKV